MKIEVEFAPVEVAVLKTSLDIHADILLSRWGVSSFPDFIKLLALHGSDNLNDLIGEDTGSKE